MLTSIAGNPLAALRSEAKVTCGIRLQIEVVIVAPDAIHDLQKQVP
jgi:hypothetical protein